MSLHEPCLVWKVEKGSEVLLHWWTFTLEEEAALESHFPCTEEEEEEEEEVVELGTQNRVSIYRN